MLEALLSIFSPRDPADANPLAGDAIDWPQPETSCDCEVCRGEDLEALAKRAREVA